MYFTQKDGVVTMESSTGPNILNYNAPISSTNKNILQSYPTKWLDEFVIMIARTAHGDLNKKIRVYDVWEKLDLKAIEGEYKKTVIKNIINVLASKSLINIINEDEIYIKYEIVDLAVKLTNEPYTNFGLISPNELEERLEMYVYRIYNETEIQKRPIHISIIQDMFQGYPNMNVIKQMIRYYNNKELVRYDETNELIYSTQKGLQYVN